MTIISFTVTEKESALIHEIAKRAVKMAFENDIQYDLLTAEMDITATHANGNPLKLQELLDADDSNFGHDVFGIRRHLNRETGQLKDFFVPRYSQPEN